MSEARPPTPDQLEAEYKRQQARMLRTAADTIHAVASGVPGHLRRSYLDDRADEVAHVARLLDHEAGEPEVDEP